MASRLQLLRHPAKSPQPRGRHHKNVRQNMKTLLLTFALLTCALVRAEVSGFPNFPFLHARGTASKQLPPDMAQLHFQLKVFAQKSEVAAQKFNECEQAVFQILSSASILPADIIAGDISKKAVQERGSDYEKSAIIGYTTVSYTHLTLPTKRIV